MNDDKKKSDAPISAIALVLVLLFVLVVYFISQIAYASSLFLAEGGWIWLIVIIAIGIFAYWLSKHSGRK